MNGADGHGTHFLPYVRLCDALGIPWTVITDGDPDDDGEKAGDARLESIRETVADPKTAAELPVAVGETTFEYDIFTTSDENAATFKRVLGGVDRSTS